MLANPSCGWSRAVNPHGKETLKKNTPKKGDSRGTFRDCLWFISLIHTTDDIPCEILFPVACRIIIKRSGSDRERKGLYREKTVYIKTHKTAINRPVDHTGET